MTVITRDTQQSYSQAIEGLYSASIGLSGEEMIKSLCYQIHSILGANYVFVGRIDKDEPEDKEVISTFMILQAGQVVKNMEFNLVGTPCEIAIRREPCCYAKRVSELFPDGELLRTMAIEAYAGAPLHDSNGKPIGVIASLFYEEVEDIELAINIMKLYSVRISQELLSLKSAEQAD